MFSDERDFSARVEQPLADGEATAGCGRVVLDVQRVRAFVWLEFAFWGQHGKDDMKFFYITFLHITSSALE